MYDAYWSPDGFSPVDHPLYGHLLEVLNRQVRSDHDALDLGCGDGSHCGPWLSQRARSYVGADVSETAIGLARQQGREAVVIEDAAKLPFDDGSFDVVVCIEVLEHLLDPLGAAREALRVLRPGGTLVATVPNVAHWRARADALLGRWNPTGDHLSAEQPWRDPHIRFFSPVTLRRMLFAAGFHQVEVIGLQEGKLLHRMPGVRRVIRNRRPGTVGRALARRYPALLAERICATSTLLEHPSPALGRTLA
jgi:SAM-dependent methyltransferase